MPVVSVNPNRAFHKRRQSGAITAIVMTYFFCAYHAPDAAQRHERVYARLRRYGFSRNGALQSRTVTNSGVLVRSRFCEAALARATRRIAPGTRDSVIAGLDPA